MKGEHRQSIGSCQSLIGHDNRGWLMAEPLYSSRLGELQLVLHQTTRRAVWRCSLNLGALRARDTPPATYSNALAAALLA
jgi:hypothetical protein